MIFLIALIHAAKGGTPCQLDRERYLERARECREMAVKARGEDKTKLLKIADAWLELANKSIVQDLSDGIDVTPRVRKSN